MISMRIKQVFYFIVYQLKMLKHRPRMVWNAAWIRKDEFHSSLDMDFWAMRDMNGKDKDKYLKNLMRRREIAHSRDLHNFY
jgi:hypothetical protein